MLYDQFDDEDERRRDALYDSLLTQPAPDAVDVPDALDQYAAQPAAVDTGPAIEPEPAAPLDMTEATAYGDALEGRRRDAMSEYLSAATTPQPPSTGAKVGEFLGDNAVGLLGSFIDLAANKGRNIPQIMTANAAMADQSRQARGAAEDRAMDFQLKAQAQRATAANAQRQTDYQQALQQHWAQQQANADRVAGARAEGLDLRKDLFKVNNTADHPIVNALRARLYATGKFPEGTLDGLSLNAMRADPTIKGQVELAMKEAGIPLAARQAGASAAAAAAGKLGVETSAPMVEAQARAEGTIAEARGAGAERGKLSVDKIDIDRLAQQNPILNFGDKVLAQQALNKLGYKFTDAISGANRSAHIIQGFYNLKKEFDSLPARVQSGELTFMQGVNRAAALKTAWNGHTDELAGVMSKISNASGVAPREDVKHMVPWIENPLSDDKVAGLWDSVAENIKGNLGTFGITAAPPQFLSELNQGPAFQGGAHGAPPAPAAAPTKQVKPGYTRMRNPDTGNEGWVLDAKVKDKQQRLRYEVVQ